MTVHARRVASVPRRTSVETWSDIVELITATGSAARTELLGVRGVGAAAIAEEYTRESPIIVSGSGPQIRIYTLHGADAVEADLSDERPLGHDPTDGQWTLSIPCGDTDLDDFRQLVAAAAHVEIRPLAGDEKAARAEPTIAVRPSIDLAALDRS